MDIMQFPVCSYNISCVHVIVALQYGHIVIVKVIYLAYQTGEAGMIHTIMSWHVHEGGELIDMAWHTHSMNSGASPYYRSMQASIAN
jgi:hypothetical protein